MYRVRSTHARHFCVQPHACFQVQNRSSYSCAWSLYLYTFLESAMRICESMRALTLVTKQRFIIVNACVCCETNDKIFKRPFKIVFTMKTTTVKSS